MASANNNSTTTTTTTTTTTSTNKPFHTYENVGYDDHLLVKNNNIGYAPGASSSPVVSATGAMPSIVPNSAAHATIGGANSSVLPAAGAAALTNASIACNGSTVNKTAIESPFPDPLLGSSNGGGGSCASVASDNSIAPKILSTSTDSTGTTTRMVAPAAATATATSTTTTSSRLNPSSGLVTRLITFPPQSPMDSLKEWSLSTFKCTKQLINEKRGLCPVTSDSQLANEIDQLRENRNKLVQMLRLGQQMVNHYGQLVRTQRQLYSLVNEMSIKCFTGANTPLSNQQQVSLGPSSSSSSSSYKLESKQVVANFSSLSNNLSSSTTTTTTTAQSPTRRLHHLSRNNNNNNSNHLNHRSNNHQSDQQHQQQHQLTSMEDFLPVLNHMNKTFNDTNLVDDFKKNAITLNVAIRNGEKLIAALNFYNSNLSTLINKTIEDTLDTVKQFELARLEYDAEKNSLSLLSASSQTSATYSSDKVELARLRYEQLREDVQIKMRFLEENTSKVMHKQLLLFNGAFASYTAGNTAALDSTLKQFSIKE